MITTLKNFLRRFPRHWVVAASAWGGRAISALIQIISIRTLLSYLGEERYAVYVIAYSLSGWFALSDCGLGSSLQNFISECRSKNENYDKYLQAALQIIFILIILFIVILIILSPFIQNKLFQKYMYLAELRTVNIILSVGCLFLISTFVNIVYRIYYALQKGYIASFLHAFALIISMILIVIVDKFSPIRSSILLALLAFSVPQVIIISIPFIKIFKNYFTKLFDYDFLTLKQLMLRSAKFGGLAVMLVIAMQVDYIIMSQTVTSSEITTYNILNKIFLLLLFVYSAVMAALWPLFTEMWHSGKYYAIKKMLQRYIFFGFLIVMSGTFVIWMTSDIYINLLAPASSIDSSAILLIIFGIYYLLRIWCDTFTTFLHSINVLKIFWIYLPVQALLSAGLQFYFSKKFGIYGILIGLIISFLLTNFWLLPYKTYKIFKSRDQNATV